MFQPERDFWYSDHEDSGQPCWFWDGIECHFECLVVGLGGPCADCPEENAAIETLAAPSDG